jgi:hypothetical protein
MEIPVADDFRVRGDQPFGLNGLCTLFLCIAD